MRLIFFSCARRASRGGFDCLQFRRTEAREKFRRLRPRQLCQRPSDGVRRVTITELKDLMAKNEAVVIDVRNQASYDAGHIAASRLIPEAEVKNHSDELPKDKLIVTYCS